MKITLFPFLFLNKDYLLSKTISFKYPNKDVMQNGKYKYVMPKL